MNWAVERTAEFWDDYAHRINWYLGEAGHDLAKRLEDSVAQTISRIALEPTLGRKRRFRHPLLQGLRSVCLVRPFGSLILFYRIDGGTVEVWRLMHGAQDLGRRLLEPNN